MANVQVKSFRAYWSNWKTSWRWSAGGKSSISLPVTFRLVLASGSSKRDCMVGQWKRGRMSNGSSVDKFSDWEADGPESAYWWNGDKMSSAGYGEWDSAGLVATFEDDPGFHGAEGDLYMGDILGGPGYFQFRTRVVKKDSSLTTLAEINWWMRIDVPNPGKGGLWWSYSDQKPKTWQELEDG